MGADNGFFSDNADDNSQRTDASETFTDQRGVFDGRSAGVTGDNSSLIYDSTDLNFRQETTGISDSFNVTDGGAFQLVSDTLALTLASNDKAIAAANEAAKASSAAAAQAAAQAAQVSGHSIGAMRDLSGDAIKSVVSMGKTSTDMVAASMKELLGFGADALDFVQDFGGIVKSSNDGVAQAYKTAASISSGQENIVKVGLVVAGIIGLVALSVFMKKG